MKKWNFYTSNEIKPSGWIKKQLEIQAEGLNGNLDKVWRDVRDSKWIGGDAEGWERVPYWLDGFIPLAYLLEDEDKIARAKKFIDAIISFQKPDGWICPCDDDKRATYDTWAVLLLTKVFTVYYECSKDEKIVDVLYSALKNYYELLEKGEVKLFEWGKYRWYEGFIAIEFLYKRFPEQWLLDLAKLLKAQGMDYNTVIEQWKRPLNKWSFDTHIVNLVMTLKYEAVSCDLLGEEYTDDAERLVQILERYNGMPVGMFTGDECLSGLSPIQGAELCSVVELMYTYELLYAYTGDKKWAERLELLAFNALPATISDDMWAHQYGQMSNQIACIRFPGKSIFRTNNSEAHMFGLEPNFGCCTANFGQGWPKLALSSFMYNGNTVISAVPVPTVLNADGKKISLETNYPFENSFKYTINAENAFDFKVRVPSFAKNVKVNGDLVLVAGDCLNFDIASGETVIEISYDVTPYFEKRPYGLNTVKCGSLTFSVPIGYEPVMREYERDGIERKFPYCDYEYVPTTNDWNYAYCDTELSVERREVGDVPFSSKNPPVVIKAGVKKISWGLADGYETVCAKVPESTTPISDKKEIELWPYGCSKLRMTELPFCE